MMRKITIIITLALCCTQQLKAQQDTSLAAKASKWVGALHLADEAKAVRVKAAVAEQLTAVRDWHNTHPTTLIPDGINPATGNRLSDIDKQVILCSAQPQSIHENLMKALRADLDSAQVDQILDQYTVGKVAFTLKGYQAIVPDLTPAETAAILKNLQQARAQAIDYKSMKEIVVIFEIYKTKCEQYLNNNGRNWRQLYKAYADKIKAEKAAAQKQ
ncbi:MAG: DUF3826 domain-containing protein [Bacteroidetes bacterium]|nr:DUF3826 domain-containing protein [Bacteroidota bacterium]